MRALIVSYAFPPVGGAGVQRVLKLVKYLPAHGVTPTVLTVANPSVPLRDESLLREVPPEVTVLEAPTLEPSYATKELAWRAQSEAAQSLLQRARARGVGLAKLCLVPDPQVLWLPAAARALIARMSSRERPDVVLVSGPPFSTFVLGALARWFPGTAVVLDYRDEWTTTRAVYEMAAGPAARVGAWLEPRLLARAHAVTTATPAFRAELLARFDYLDPERVRTIENGYDPADFPAALPEPPSDRCVLTYAGTVFRLTSARTLVQAIRLLHEREPALARLLEVRFIGRIVDTEASYFEDCEAIGIRRLGYLEHGRVIEELARSHAALCLLDDVPGAERIYPAKIFELMRIGRPCLVLAPEGALAALARKHGLGDVVPPRDVEAITDALARTIAAFRDTGRAPSFEPREVERFDRRRQAGDFADLFGLVVDAARSPRRLRSSAASAQERQAVSQPL